MKKVNSKVFILFCLVAFSFDTTYSMDKNSTSKKGRKRHHRTTSSWAEFNKHFQGSFNTRCRIVDEILAPLPEKKTEKKPRHERETTLEQYDNLLDEIKNTLPDEVKKEMEKERQEKLKAMEGFENTIKNGDLEGFINLLYTAPVENISEIINETTQARDSFLHIATRYNHKKIVKYLLEKTDIDINLFNNDGKIAFQIACENNNSPIQRLIFKKFVIYQGNINAEAFHSYFVKPKFKTKKKEDYGKM